MISIDPTIATNFCARQNRPLQQRPVQNRQYTPIRERVIENKPQTIALMGLSTIAIAIIGIKTCTPISIEKALAKSGVELRNGIAYIKESGKKFTGSVERHSKAFRREKEVRNYVDGVLTEELRYDRKNREVSANFYRDGKLFREAYLSCYRGGGEIIRYREYGNGTYRYKGKTVITDITKKGSLERKGAFEILRQKGEVPGPDERFVFN